MCTYDLIYICTDNTAPQAGEHLVLVNAAEWKNNTSSSIGHPSSPVFLCVARLAQTCNVLVKKPAIRRRVEHSLKIRSHSEESRYLAERIEIERLRPRFSFVAQ